jgi:hypothetical protein
MANATLNGTNERRLYEGVQGVKGSEGEHRARSHCRSVPPLVRFIPLSLKESVPLFLKRQCRGTWARVTINQFRRLALQTCYGQRVSMNILANQMFKYV